MAKPKISSKNGASTFINFCSLGFNIIFSFGNIGTDLFKKLKQHSHVDKTGTAVKQSKIIMKS